MTDEKIKSFISQALSKGYTKEKIRNTLLKAGHNIDIVEEHLKSAEAEYEKKTNALLYVLIFFVAASTILGIVNIALYLKQTPPQKYDTLVTESKSLCSEGKFDKAFKNLNDAMKMDKTNSRAFGIMGFCYLQQNKFLESIPVLTEAVRINSREPLLFYRLGVAYCSLNNINLGVANLNRAIELNPSSPDFYKGIADCYTKAGNEKEAGKYLNLLNETTSKNVTLGGII